MKRYHLKYYITLFLLLQLKVTAQVNDGFIFRAQSSNPSSSSNELAKVSEMPVDLSRGVVAVNVPVCEGVSLTYHTTGIKVNDIATQIGLGWNLQAGGVITRIVRGLPDDQVDLDGNRTGYSTAVFGTPGKGKEVDEFIANPVKSDPVKEIEYYQKFLNGSWDGEPDIYYFNFLGRSGKFVLDKDGNALLIPQQDIKIHQVGPVYHEGKSQLQTQWIIRTSDGSQYFFGNQRDGGPAVETTEITTTTADVLCVAPATQTFSFASCWYLKKVISSEGTTLMDIKYRDNGKSISYDFVTQNKYDYLGVNNGTPTCAFLLKSKGTGVYVVTTTNKILNPLYVSYITTPIGTTKFSYTAREDLQGGDKLSSIEVIDSEGVIVKKINFVHSYFGSGNSRRLKLEAILDENQKTAYQFGYNMVNLPERNSSQIDHWGYFNGATITDLKAIPAVTYIEKNAVVDCPSPGCSFPGGTRDPNIAFAQASTLNRIVFPSGGSTSYTYELNEYFDGANEQEWGGLRVKTIETKDGITDKSITTEYKYILDEKNSSSKSSGTLDEIYSIAQRRYYKKIIIMEGNDIFGYPTNSAVAHFLLRTSEPINNRDFTLGNELIYRKVIVSQTGNGKSVYSFTSHAAPENVADVDPDIKTDLVDHRDIKAEKFSVSGNYPREFSEPPYLSNTSRSWERGLITDIKIYSEQDKLRSWKHFQYDFNPSGITNRSINGISLFSMAYQAYKENVKSLTGFGSPYYGKYTIDSKRFFLEKITERIYNQSDETKFLQTVSSFVFNINNYQVSQITETNSDGKITIINNKYAIDYPDNGEKIGLIESDIDVTDEVIGGRPVIKNLKAITNEMRARNMISQVIEQQTWVKKNSTSSKELLSAGIINYKIFPRPSGFKFYFSENINFDPFAPGYLYKNTMILPYQNLKVYSNTSIPESNYTASSIDANFNFTYDQSKCTIEATNTFDNKIGLPISTTLRGSINQCTIWDFKNLVPMAKVENATIDKVAFTSFEVDGEMGYWNYPSASITTTDAKSGTKSFAGTVKINTSLPAGAYKLSFWCKGSGSIAVSGSSAITSGAEWTYKEILLTNPGALEIATGAVKIDELRVHPENARMVTNVYKPMVGITSSMDVNNVQTYYEYDNNQRLKLTRDDDKNILQQNIYKLGNN